MPNIKTDFTKRFEKQYRQADPSIKEAFEGRLNIFIDNPFNVQLRNHSLKGKWLGYRSIDITGDWRAVYREEIDQGEKIIIFVALGTHSQLYR